MPAQPVLDVIEMDGLVEEREVVEWGECGVVHTNQLIFLIEAGRAGCAGRGFGVVAKAGLRWIELAESPKIDALRLPAGMLWNDDAIVLSDYRWCIFV